MADRPDIPLQDLTKMTELDGTENVVLFNTQEGRSATVNTLKRYIEKELDFPNAHGTGLFGAKWDRLTNKLTRTRDAADITTDTTNFVHKGSLNANYKNPFDDIYPWSEMTQCNVDLVKYRQGYAFKDCITAVYGDPDFTYEGTVDLFVGRYTPEFWYKSQEDSNGVVEYLISQNERVGFIKHEESIQGVSFCIDAGDNKVKTGTGIPLTNVSASTIHTRANNSGYTLTDIYDLDGIIALYLVEYANMHGQGTLGDGCSNCYRQNAIDTVTGITTTDGHTVFTVEDSDLSTLIYKGTQLSFGASSGATAYKGVVSDFSVNGAKYTITLREQIAISNGMYMSVHGFDACEFPLIGQSLGNASGYLGTAGKANVYYRGSLAFANRYAYTLGVYRQTATNNVWRCPVSADPDKFNYLDTSKHIDTKIALPDISGAWQTVGANAKRLPDLACFMATGTSNGSSSTPVGDQQYVPTISTTDTILLFGGSAIVGWTCGWFCGAWDRAAGTSNWNFAGFPILKKNL